MRSLSCSVVLLLAALSTASCDDQVSLADSESACNEASDCFVTSVEPCVCEPVTKADLKAVNTAHLPDQVICNSCVAQPETQTRHYFVPRCRSHECVVTDIRETDAVSCRHDSDCRLRGGANCCASCVAAGEPVAVSVSEGDRALCPDGPLPCPAPCLHDDTTGLSATCDAGRCTVNYAVSQAQ